MATTLRLVKFLSLGWKNNIPFIHAKVSLLCNSSKSDVCEKDSCNPHKLFTETIRYLSSASLSLTLHFFLRHNQSHHKKVFKTSLLFYFSLFIYFLLGGDRSAGCAWCWWGVWRSCALIHPILMWAGYLGWQWRRVWTHSEWDQWA